MIRNSRVFLAAGPCEFAGTLEYKIAPAAIAWLVGRFPLQGTVLHACWSGEAAWLPLGGAPQLAPENALDRNVDVAHAPALFKAAFTRAGMKDFTVQIYKNAGHTLKVSATG